MSPLLGLLPAATLADDNWLAVAVVAIPGTALVIICSALDTWRKTQQTRQREESRREIAAYVAEGSISPDDAAKLLAAGESFKDKICANR